MTDTTDPTADRGATGAVEVVLTDAAATRSFGTALASVLRAGDLVVLTGDLGAGKTTLTQGIGAGLGVRGQVASPTFIVAREHPSLVAGPGLVHVDAYRLGSLDEVDALDLDSSLDESVTVVEWGEGLVESLAGDRLEIVLERPRGDAAPADGPDHDVDESPEAGERRVTVRAVGARWEGLDVGALAEQAGVAVHRVGPVSDGPVSDGPVSDGPVSDGPAGRTTGAGGATTPTARP